jgi:putative intracellular protease/amidase
MNILMVLTSHDELGATGYRTGFWFEDFTAPYYAFLDAGADLTLASPQGGSPPIDPRSIAADAPVPSIERFRADPVVRTLLSDTLRLEQIDLRDFDAAYLPGGHGALWDLSVNPHCGTLVKGLLCAGKSIALVGHSPVALLNVFDDAGRPLVTGRNLTCFSNSEESAAGLKCALPCSLQDQLIRLGANYSKAQDGAPHVVQDGPLITGQNAASALDAAHRVLKTLQR